MLKLPAHAFHFVKEKKQEEKNDGRTDGNRKNDQFGLLFFLPLNRAYTSSMRHEQDQREREKSANVVMLKLYLAAN